MNHSQNNLEEIRKLNFIVFLRSFFLETIWNYNKLQNIGFFYAFQSVLRKLFSSQQGESDAVRRHLESVNTNPVFGPLLLGVTTRLEQDSRPESVPAYKKRMMAAIAAHGDRLFWGHIRPFAALSGVIAGISQMSDLVAILVLLMVYNIPSISMRYHGFQIGVLEGVQVLRILKSWRMEALIALLRAALNLGLGILVGLSLAATIGIPWAVTGFSSKFILLLTVIGICAVGTIVLRKKLSSTILIYLAVLFIVITSMAIGI